MHEYKSLYRPVFENPFGRIIFRMAHMPDVDAHAERSMQFDYQLLIMKGVDQHDYQDALISAQNAPYISSVHVTRDLMRQSYGQVSDTSPTCNIQRKTKLPTFQPFGCPFS